MTVRSGEPGPGSGSSCERTIGNAGWTEEGRGRGDARRRRTRGATAHSSRRLEAGPLSR